jgi:hypothetical protein
VCVRVCARARAKKCACHVHSPAGFPPPAAAAAAAAQQQAVLAGGGSGGRLDSAGPSAPPRTPTQISPPKPSPLLHEA